MKQLAFFVLLFMSASLIGCTSSHYQVSESVQINGKTVATAIDTSEKEMEYMYYLQIQKKNEIERIRLSRETYFEAQRLIRKARTGKPEDVGILKEFLKRPVLSPLTPEEVEKIKEGSKR